jgi:glycine/D-amino acid oxidase-like deaminating enzyme
MKLRTGKPLWLAKRPQPLRARRTRRAVTCDVAIVGAGITGALVSYHLIKAGLRVVLLDKHDAGYGSTAANTGLLLYQPDTTMAEIAQRYGRQAAARVYQLGRKAIRDIGSLIRTLRIDCGWQSRRTLYVASKPSDVAILRREANRTHQTHLPAQLLSRRALQQRYHLDFPAALATPGAAEVHAFDLTRGIVRHCLRHNRFRYRKRTRVRSVQEDRDGVTLHLDKGRVRANRVIVATGYEIRPFVTSDVVRLHSTYVIASKPFPPAKLRPLRCLMWETARPYFYLRTTAEHRIVFGGLDDSFTTPTRRDRKLATKTRQLEKQFARLFPALAFTADYAWTGAFADTRDGLPYIGPARRNSRILYALGYGGNGITYSQIAAGILRDICLGRSNPDAELFGFRRDRRDLSPTNRRATSRSMQAS